MLKSIRHVGRRGLTAGSVGGFFRPTSSAVRDVLRPAGEAWVASRAGGRPSSSGQADGDPERLTVVGHVRQDDDPGDDGECTKPGHQPILSRSSGNAFAVGFDEIPRSPAFSKPTSTASSNRPVGRLVRGSRQRTARRLRDPAGHRRVDQVRRPVGAACPRAAELLEQPTYLALHEVVVAPVTITGRHKLAVEDRRASSEPVIG